MTKSCKKSETPLFAGKRKPTIIAIIIGLLIQMTLLQGCDLFKKTEKKTTNTNSPTTSKTVTIKRTKPSSKPALLKSSGTNGVQSFTLSDVDIKSLSRDETKQLDALASEIKAMGSCQVTVIGHADNTGTSEVNEAVSVNRARLVADYLKKKGVTNITTSGESYNHPVAGNDTAEGRAKNRRVEIYVSTVGKYNPYK